VSTSDTWGAISFWTENLTEVLIRSFLKTEVLSVMQIEIQELKNKVSKTQGSDVYLTKKKKKTRTRKKSEEIKRKNREKREGMRGHARYVSTKSLNETPHNPT
jgi:hypothetical protein